MVARYIKLGILLIIVGVSAIYVLFVIVPQKSYDTARAIGQDFREAFQFTPEVRVRNTIVLNQQTAILELATMSQNFQHRYTWNNTWIGSTKQIEITGTFNAKCGFDLQKKFSIHLEGKRATVYLPDPVVLSVEPQGDMTFRDESGYWNWVNDDDRARATNAFITDARRYAEQSTFASDASKTAEEKVRMLLKPHVDEVVFVYMQEARIEQGR
jgi:hypothetical protein